MLYPLPHNIIIHKTASSMTGEGKKQVTVFMNSKRVPEGSRAPSTLCGDSTRREASWMSWN
jgi:hypothetical protein